KDQEKAVTKLEKAFKAFQRIIIKQFHASLRVVVLTKNEIERDENAMVKRFEKEGLSEPKAKVLADEVHDDLAHLKKLENKKIAESTLLLNSVEQALGA
ncbi:hypothetical protein ACFL96_17265, partial [Thermoproteota archaeon]